LIWLNLLIYYALPGYLKPDIHHVKTDTSEFFAVAIDYKNLGQAAISAKALVDQHGVNMIELCGGLANADIVSQVKAAVGPKVVVGQVMYGPEMRRPLVDLLNL